MKTWMIFAAMLLSGCGGAYAVHSSYMRLPFTEVPVSIEHSAIKSLRVYTNPTGDRAMVCPPQGQATAESLNVGIAGWAARSTINEAAYGSALQQVLKQQGKTCATAPITPLVDALAYEFSLTCDQAISRTTLVK